MTRPRRAWLPWSAPTLAALLLLVRLLVPAGDGLEARYFDSVVPAGAPARAGVDHSPSSESIRRRWGTSLPDRFSATWSGFLAVPSRGAYQFATTSDDGSQLFVDDSLVVDNGGVHAPQTRTGLLRLTSGPHRVRLVFVQDRGDFTFEWSWAREGGTLTPVPAWLLSTRPVRTAAAYAARSLDLAFMVVVVPAGVVIVWTAFLWTRRASIPPAVWRWSERIAGIAAVILPVFLVAHAIAFWGRGVIDEEATTFVINYLADRPFLQSILDPRLNDWGSFQARELAYVFDRMDARVFARLLVDHHVLLFVPLSAMLCLPAICGVFLVGARRVLRLGWTTALLLLSLFLSCVVTQASTPILYRSSKMLLSVAALAFLFLLTWMTRPERRRLGAGSAAGLFGIGVLMSMCDRQGYAYLLSATTVIAALWVRQRWLRPRADQSPDRPYGRVAAVSAATTIAAIAYNNIVAPNAILRANGYWPDMSYEDIPFERFDSTLALNALRMFRDEVSYFFGNLPFVAVCALGALLWVVAAPRRPRSGAVGLVSWLTSPGVMIAAAFPSVLLVLITVMGMRHPPVFRIVDHAFWYYTLSMQAVLLFAVALAVAQLRLEPRGREGHGHLYLWAIILVLIASNVAHYPAQRKLLEESGEWFGKQLAFAQLYAKTFDADEAGDPAVAGPLPSWMRTRPDGIDVRLPLRAYGLLDAVRAGYATLHGRTPLVDAGGPYWRELRDFLDGSGSPLAEPDNLRSAIEAMQSVGVRRIVVHRRDYEQPLDADAAIAAAQSLDGRVRQVVVHEDAATIELADVRREALPALDWRVVPSSAFRLTASAHGDQLPLAVDGRVETEWNSTSAQDGQEWIRVEFDRPRKIAALRLLVTDQGLARYPRALTIESTGAGGTRTLFTGSTLEALFHGLLTQPVDAPIELRFPPSDSSVVVIRQTGRSPSWSWGVRELQILEAGTR